MGCKQDFFITFILYEKKEFLELDKHITLFLYCSSPVEALPSTF